MFGFYDRGNTPFAACQTDPRFSYCLYVPLDYDEHGTQTYPLVALIHGTDRTAAEYRNLFAEFCERNACIVIAPLFPIGVTSPGEIDDYKFIDFGGVRFDHVFLSMVDEVTAKYRVTDRMLMHGFSGGAHFAHRFFYLHPSRLAAVSIGAPGLVTLLDDSLPWWAGTRDFGDRFGVNLDYDAMRDVAVHLVVGAKDTETWEITVPVDSPLWVEGADQAGVTRIERLTSLRESLALAGIETRFDTVPGVRHNGYQLLDAVRDFFAEALLPK
jgi:poly(3-hydroxybutyrate) depolymerase